MDAALEKLGLRKTNRGVFCGEWRGSGPVVERVSPIDGKVIAAVREATPEDYEWAILRAQAAFLKWRTTPAPVRGETIRRLGNALRRLKKQWHPLGVVGVITAFNFPVAVWSWNSALAAVCGDSVVWKPSNKTPLTAIAVTLLAEHVCRETGADPAIFTLIIGGVRTIGERMTGDRRIQ